MKDLRSCSDVIQSRVRAAKDHSLYRQLEADLELRVWAIAEGVKALDQPEAPKDLAAKVEGALREVEGILEGLDRGQDIIDRRRGMVVRGFQVTNQNHPQPYGIHVPQAYDAGKAWPLFIYLHGGGGTIEQYRFALDRLAAPPPASQPAAQPAPSAPIQQMLKIWLPRRGKNWAEPLNEESVFAAIADVQARYNVDVNRVYVQGFSLGGFATVHYAVRFPDRFAGAGPSGMTSDYDVLPLAENLTNLPTFLCHGTLDDVCDVRTSAGLFGRLKELRCDSVLQEEFRLPHQSTDLARAAQESWLLTKTRNPWPDKVVYVTDDPRYHRAYWIDILKMDVTPARPLARVEAVRSGPGQFSLHTKGVRSLAICLVESIAPKSKPVTVSVNDHESRTYPWPEDGRLVLDVLAEDRR